MNSDVQAARHLSEAKQRRQQTPSYDRLTAAGCHTGGRRIQQTRGGRK